MNPKIGGVLALALIMGDGAAARADLSNGGFETGNFTGWTKTAFLDKTYATMTGGPQYSTFLAAQAGPNAVTTADSNAVVTSQTSSFDGQGPASSPAIGPVEGKYLAFISTEAAAGDGSLTASSISQTFTVTSGLSVLSLNARFLSNDIGPITPGYGYDDFAGVALKVGNTVIGQFNFDLDPTSSANDHIIQGAAAGGFQGSTGWDSINFNVAAYVGQSLTLVAYASNYGDDYTESRLLLDNVHLAVPEPSSFALCAMAGLAGLAGVALRRSRRSSGSAAPFRHHQARRRPTEPADAPPLVSSRPGC